MPEAPTDGWRTYDEFAAGIATYRLPDADLTGRDVTITLDDGEVVSLSFKDSEHVVCNGVEDPYDAVAVRDDVLFVNLPLTSVDGEALTVVYSTTSHRALAVRSAIGAEDVVPRVSQSFQSGVTDGGTPSGVAPGPSRDLIGKRNLYRYSPEHLYEHIYVSSERIQFPGATEGLPVERPAAFSDDRSYFLFAVLVLVACGLLVHFLRHGRWGSSWHLVAFSERGTAAVGAGVRTSKLTAFAVSAALGGVSGGLLTGQVGLAFPASFTAIQSLALYVLAIMSGAHLIDMAVFGALLWVAVPELLKRWGVPQDWGFVIFGVLGIQALAGRGNLGTAVRNLRHRSRVPAGVGRTDVAEVPPLPPGEPVLEVRGLSVHFGHVKALSEVDISVPEHGILGVIGPNGAGKSTLVDVVSGFLPRATGTVTLDGRPLTGSPTRRARRGLRRTFQQDRVPPGLTVGAYVRFVARRRLPGTEVADALEFFGCPPARTPLSRVDAGARRLVEVVGHLLARPRVLLLDEPAAGLPHEEHVAFGRRLRQVPARFGVSVLLIEHDLDLVRSVCDRLTVLDFGEVLASGPQADVLADPAVLKAYMGETELL